MKAFYKLELLVIYKELISKSGEIILLIYVGVIDASDFFINGEPKPGLKPLARLTIKTFLYNFEKLVIFHKRDTSKIVLLL